MELGEIPARYLAHDVVQCRFEEGGGRLCHRILQFEEPVAQSELGGDERQRIACGLRCQCRRTAQSGVDLNDAVVLRLRVERILHVAFAHDADVSDDFDGKRTQFVIFAVREGLRGSHHNAFARVDAQRVEVLHVADGDAVVETVPDHFILYFLPSLQRLFHQHLRGERESLLGLCLQLLLVFAETGTQSAQGISSPQYDGEAHFSRSHTHFLYRTASLALDGLHPYLVKPFDEEVAVLCVDDGLHWRSEHFHTVLLQHTLAVKLHTAVQSRLSAEAQHDTIRAFLLDDAFHELRRHRLEIDSVCNVLRRLHRGDVRIDEHRMDALFFHRLQGLCPAVVKLTGLAYLQCTASQQEHFLYRHIIVGKRAVRTACVLHALVPSTFSPVDHRHEIIEHELRIHRARAGFGMELGREPRVCLVPDAFVRTVIHVDEERLPIGGKRAVVNGIAVVLRGDEAL